MCITVLFAFMQEHHARAMPVEAATGCWILWNWGYRWSCTIRVLGTYICPQQEQPVFVSTEPSFHLHNGPSQ